MVSSGADIQIERGGFARVHNAILEQLASHDFTSREYACILYLLRMTYGFNRKECQLSNSDFAKATNIERPAVIKTLRRLVERGVIHKGEGDPYHAATWSFNKYVEQWDTQTSVKTITSVKTTTSQNDTSSSYQNDTTSSVETTTSYISAKDNKDSERKGGSHPPEPTFAERNANGYFGMPVSRHREKVMADGYTQDAARAGVDAATFRGIVDELINAAGWRKLVDDAEDDASLNYAKRDALKLIRMGTKTVQQTAALIEAYKAANEWRGEDYKPRPTDIATYASQVGERLPVSTANGKVTGFSLAGLTGGA